VPGALADFGDMAPPPGLAAVNWYNHYDGSVSADKQLEFGGVIASNINAKSNAEMFGLAYNVPLGHSGRQVSKAVSTELKSPDDIFLELPPELLELWVIIPFLRQANRLDMGYTPLAAEPEHLLDYVNKAGFTELRHAFFSFQWLIASLRGLVDIFRVPIACSNRLGRTKRQRETAKFR